MPHTQLFPLLAACTLGTWLVTSCGGGTDSQAQAQAAQPCGGGVCVTTLAGSGEFGTTDGLAQTAQFFMPHAVAVDDFSRVHVADFGGNNQTRLIADGQVSTIPEDPIDFPHPSDVATDASGNKFVADTFGNRILKIRPDGETSVVAGAGEAGDQDCDGASASFSLPSGLAFDRAGALFVADMGNRKIRKITFAGASGA